jgi:beta-lactamase regulating signal transducer with metallopeptidase domain
MSGESLWMICWSVFGLLAAEVALLVGIAGLIARRVTSAVWRRTVWQSCVLALLGLLVMEISGSARYIAGFAAGKGRAAHPSAEAPPAMVGVRSDSLSVPPQASLKQSSRPNIHRNPILPPEPAEVVPTLAREDARPTPLMPSEDSAGMPLPAENSPTSLPLPAASLQGPEPRPGSLTSTQSTLAWEEVSAWLVVSWLCGALVFIAINALARLSFARLRHRSRTVTDPSLRKRVEELACRMGLRRPIHLFESPRLLGPVAAGVLRPAIGLPPQFASEHSPEQQGVMLAHEVAHLAAKDPLWSRLADVLAALLWWHPLAWWARRQLRAASETAADESSLLVRDGPRVLAECLVTLGGRLTRRQPVGWMGVEGAGFRSGLARRVERLLRLPAREWSPPGRVRSALARTLAPAAIVVAVIFCTAWTIPQPSTNSDRMKNRVWNRSLPLYALLAAFWTPDPPAVAADAPKPAPSPPAAPEPVHTLLKAAAFPVSGAEGAARLKAKLDSIVLDQVTYDAIPLNQVVESLMKEAAAKDPEKVGVNFLFGQPAEPIRAPAAIDPATGLPAAPAPSKAIEVPDVTATIIRIVPPLKKVRLIDALNAIKRVADQPITYTVEGYAVVFSLDSEAIYSNLGLAYTPRPPPPVVQAFTRSFKLDTNTFFVSVKKMLGRQIEPASERVGEDLRQDIFPLCGVKWNATENIAFYNPRTGVLLVRASQEDLDTIRAVIETLGGTAADNAARGNSPFDPALARGSGGSPSAPPKQ